MGLEMPFFGKKETPEQQLDKKVEEATKYLTYNSQVGPERPVDRAVYKHYLEAQDLLAKEGDKLTSEQKADLEDVVRNIAEEIETGRLKNY